jgi:hypothetical protein
VFEKGDFRTSIPDFQNPEIIDKMKMNRSLLEERFSNHPNPLMHGLVDALLSDVTTGCVLLGQRNVQQVEAASLLGNGLSKEDAQWVKALYKL